VAVSRTQEDGEPDDPRAELMQRLLESKKLRSAALRLQNLPRLSRDFWVGSAECLDTEDVLYPTVTGEEMLEAWMGVLSRLKLTQKHRVSRQELSIREHMSEMLKRLQRDGTLALGTLFNEEKDREKITVWFLAMLELAKEGLIVLTQAEPFSEIYASLPGEERALFPGLCNERRWVHFPSGRE
ncbi:segregation and condensation protein A, partial [gut metagenome]